MKKIVGFILLLALSSLASANSQIEFSSKQEEQLRQALIRLDLTSEQRAVIDKVILDVDPQIIKYTIQFNNNKYELDNLVGANYNEEKINFLAEEQGDIESQVIQLRMSVRHQIYDVLTPMQRIKAGIFKLTLENVSQNG